MAAAPPVARSAAELLGAPPAPRQGREHILAVAIEQFYRHGFNATGLDRVLREAHVSKTTFYKHFKSKDDLMVAAVQRRDEWERLAWAGAVKKLAGDDPRRQLRAFFEVMDVWFTDPGFGGCMFINAAAEFPNPADPVHRAAAAHKHATRNEVRDLALAAGAAPDRAETFADLYMILFEGTLIMRQAHGRDDAARLALVAVDALLREYLS